MKFVAWLQILLGAGIAGLWTMLLITGQVPEIEAGQIDIWFHIAAEFAAAALLLVGGVAVLQHRRHAPLLAAVALGMVGYSAIASAGYYAESGDWGFVGMFGVVLVLVAAAVARVARG